MDSGLYSTQRAFSQFSEEPQPRDSATSFDKWRAARVSIALSDVTSAGDRQSVFNDEELQRRDSSVPPLPRYFDELDRVNNNTSRQSNAPTACSEAYSDGYSTPCSELQRWTMKTPPYRSPDSMPGGTSHSQMPTPDRSPERAPSQASTAQIVEPTPTRNFHQSFARRSIGVNEMSNVSRAAAIRRSSPRFSVSTVEKLNLVATAMARASPRTRC